MLRQPIGGTKVGVLERLPIDREDMAAASRSLQKKDIAAWLSANDLSEPA